MTEAKYAVLEQKEREKEGEESEGFEEENILKAEDGKYYNLHNSSCSFELGDV